MKRSVLLEMLILEAKGFLDVDPKRIIERCCGWADDTCDEDMEYGKYIEAYDTFFMLNKEYVTDNFHDFAPSVIFDRIKYRIDEGYPYKQAVIKMIQDRFFCSKIPLAEPPHEYLKQEFKDALKLNPHYLDMYLFKDKIEFNSLFLEIIES